MFRNTKRIGRWIAIAVVIGLVCSSAALAKKPPGPAYELRVLEGTGIAHDIQQQDGVVEIVGTSSPDARSGVYWLLNAAGGTVMSVNLPCTEGHLSGASGLNRDGAIVGWRSVAGIENTGRPVFWTTSPATRWNCPFRTDLSVTPLHRT